MRGSAVVWSALVITGRIVVLLRRAVVLLGCVVTRTGVITRCVISWSTAVAGRVISGRRIVRSRIPLRITRRVGARSAVLRSHAIAGAVILRPVISWR